MSSPMTDGQPFCYLTTSMKKALNAAWATKAPWYSPCCRFTEHIAAK